MSVARGAIGSWSTSPDSFDGDSCSPGGWLALIWACQGILLRPPTPFLALPLQVTGDPDRPRRFRRGPGCFSPARVLVAMRVGEASCGGGAPAGSQARPGG